MLVDVTQEAIEDLAFLVNEKVLESWHLLFVKQLTHDFEEIAA